MARGGVRSLALKLVLFALLVAGAVLGLRAVGIDLAHMTPERVRAFVVSFGVAAPLAYLLAYTQPIVPLPASIMTIAGGLAFGPLWGTLGALAGGTLRACAQFGVARLLGREAVAKLLRGRVAALDQTLGDNAFQAVLLIRLIPNVPFDMQNYGLGFSRVRFLPYALGTLLGMGPGCFAFVYLGYSLTDPTQIWKLLLAILVIVSLTVATRRWQRRHPSASP
jgi:uncharacterized membrane protein YdjX (TVP38/TMEM64 family)